MTTEYMVKQAFIDTWVKRGTKETGKTMCLGEFDEKYKRFFIESNLADRGRMFYYTHKLYWTRSDGECVLLVQVSNIAYSANEAAQELARVIDREETYYE